MLGVTPKQASPCYQNVYGTQYQEAQVGTCREQIQGCGDAILRWVKSTCVTGSLPLPCALNPGPLVHAVHPKVHPAPTCMPPATTSIERYRAAAAAGGSAASSSTLSPTPT